MSVARIVFLLSVSLAATATAGCASTAPQGAACPPVSASCKAFGKDGNAREKSVVGLPPSAQQMAFALSASPMVRAADARSLAAGSAIDSARAMSLPSLAFKASGLVEDDNRQSTGQRGREESYGLAVDMPLYQGGRDTAARDLARSDYMASLSNAQEVRVSTSFALIAAQLELERQDRSLAIFADHKKALLRMKRSVASEESEGSATRVDVSDVDRQLLQIDLDSRQALLTRYEAEKALTRLYAPKYLDVAAILPRLRNSLPTTVPELVDTAMRNNPRIATRMAQIDAANARVQQVKAAYNPSLSLALSVNVQHENDTSANSYQETKAMLNFTAPLYSGGAREAGLYSRKQELLAATLDKDSAVLDVRATIETSFDRLGSFNAMLSLARRQFSVTQARLTGVQMERRLGERTVYDEIRALADIAGARIGVNTAQHETSIAQLTLAAETGILANLLGFVSVSEPSAGH